MAHDPPGRRSAALGERPEIAWRCPQVAGRPLHRSVVRGRARPPDPLAVSRSSIGIRRSTASSKPRVSSATAVALTPGRLATAMPGRGGVEIDRVASHGDGPPQLHFTKVDEAGDRSLQRHSVSRLQPLPFERRRAQPSCPHVDRDPLPMKLNVLKNPKLMAFGVPVALMSQCAPQQCAPAPAPAALSVTNVVDGDTVDLSNGERVRIIGIDTPEVGEPCADVATESLRAMVSGHGVTIEGGARDDRDRYGRLLRYVMVDGATDVGRSQIDHGLAVARYDSRDGYGGHPREADYVAADAATGNACGWNPVVAPPPAPPTTHPPANNCHPAYVECLPIVADLDCPQIGHLVHLRAIGNDPYRLDGSDNDGLGCESFG